MQDWLNIQTSVLITTLMKDKKKSYNYLYECKKDKIQYNYIKQD